jgi:hypothetical protein
MRVVRLSLVLLVLILAGLAAALAAPGARAAGPASPVALPGTGFTYQGRLASAGAPVSGNCDMAFRLHDSAEGGAQLGSAITTTVAVAGGLFSLVLNAGDEFGPAAFNGQARWLSIRVRCGGEPSFTSLSPRQALTPAPIALSLPGLRTRQNDISPNLVGGYHGNGLGGVAGSVIGGGGSAAEPNSINASYAVIAGGSANTASGPHSALSGGLSNTVTSVYGVISGGHGNQNAGTFAAVGGGVFNSAAAQSAAIGGGAYNVISSTNGTIAGGIQNTVSGANAVVAGGSNNQAAAQGAAAVGGFQNTASGQYATAAGGEGNVAGGNHSFAAGRNALAIHAGSFVWAANSVAPVTSTASNQFTVLAPGGIRLRTNATNTTGCNLSAGGGTWTCTSDRNAKANFAPVDGRDVLAALISLPIETWSFAEQDPAIRHMGPAAQDFHAAFGLGQDELTISLVDADGVALAAIQGLYAVVQEKDAALASQQAEIAQQQAELAALEARLARLEQAAGMQAPAAASRGVGARPVAALAVAVAVSAAAGLGAGLGWHGRTARGRGR